MVKLLTLTTSCVTMKAVFDARVSPAREDVDQPQHLHSYGNLPCKHTPPPRGPGRISPRPVPRLFRGGPRVRLPLRFYGTFPLQYCLCVANHEHPLIWTYRMREASPAALVWCRPARLPRLGGNTACLRTPRCGGPALVQRGIPVAGGYPLPR